MRKHTHPPAAPRGSSFSARSHRRTVLRIVGLAMVGVGALGGAGVTTVISAAPASAATQGVGFGNFTPNDATPWIGSMNVGGTLVYCIDPGTALPTGSTADNGITGNVAGLSATQLAQINSVVSLHGNTSNQIQAAAVSHVVKYLANPQGMIKDLGNPGTTFDSAIDWQINTQGGTANTAAIKALANQYLSAAQSVTPASDAPTSATVSASLTVSASTDWTGTLKLGTIPGGSGTGTITLDKGVFADTGKASKTGAFTSGQTLNIAGTPPVNTGTAGYKVTATGSLTSRTPGGFAGNVHLWTTDGQQRTVSAGTKVNNTTKLSLRAADGRARQVPQLSSKAQTLTSPYADTADVVTVSGTATAFPAGGVDVTNTAYWAPGLTSSAADQKYMTAANQLTTATKTVTKAGDVTFSIDDLANKPKNGTHVFWVASVKNHATGALIQQAAFNAAGEQTPVKDFQVTTTPAKATVNPGETTRDEITVNGYVPKGTTIVVTQYQVPAGEELVCTPENQIGPSLNPVPVKAGMNNGTKYLTQWTGAQVSGNAGFVEQTYVRGTLIHTAGCHDEPFTVTTPPTPEKPTTPATPTKPTVPAKPVKPTAPVKATVAYTPAGTTTALPVVAG